jgi:hypothetical protein
VSSARLVANRPGYRWVSGRDRRDGIVDAVLLPPVAVGVDRVATRVGHGFDDVAAARRMHAQFAGVGIDPGHVVTEVVDAADAMAQLIVDRRATGRCATPDEFTDWVGSGIA